MSVITRVGQIPEVQARSAAAVLSAVDLADAAACASLGEGDPRREVLEEILCDHGCPPERATLTARALAELARAVEERWHGKIQRYLRAWGERMLDSVVTDFGVTAVPEADLREIIAWWLQGALSMPVVVADPAIRLLADQEGTTPDALVAAADWLDLNIALLDEAARLERAKPEPDESD